MVWGDLDAKTPGGQRSTPGRLAPQLWPWTGADARRTHVEIDVIPRIVRPVCMLGRFRFRDLGILDTARQERQTDQHTDRDKHVSHTITPFLG